MKRDQSNEIGPAALLSLVFVSYPFLAVVSLTLSLSPESVKRVAF
jgi:hypothetical protein